MCPKTIRAGQIPVKKVILWSVILLLVMGLLSTCNGGFNAVMYSFLKKPENYVTCTLTVIERGRTRSGEFYMKYELDHMESETDYLPEQGTLYVPEENYELLAERRFFMNFSEGDCITVTTSNLVYIDGNFFYVAALTHDGTEYLSFEEGLANIKRMMRRNPSML